MRTSTLVQAFGVLLVLKTCMASPTLVAKNEVTSGKTFLISCGKDTNLEVKPEEEGSVQIVDDPNWVCYGQIGDLAGVASKLYDPKTDANKVINQCLVEALDDVIRRFNEVTKEWEPLPNLQKH